jgi:hypothetical protein
MYPGPERLDHAEQEAPDHRARDVADAPEDSRRECLQAQD